MTTKAAEKLYLAQHEFEMQDKGYAVYNPKNLSVEDLPIIYGFNNGGSSGWYSAVLLAEDGTGLGGHCCSAEGYMLHDLGILEGTRPDRHKAFQKHYPNGYRMDFVPLDEALAKTNKGLELAYERNQKLAQMKEKK